MKSIESLQKSFLIQNPGKSILEISSKSGVELGIKLSAFNLQIIRDNRSFSVETAFQSSKVFENGGPYTDLLQKKSSDAKKDDRIRNSGKLIRFEFLGEEFPIEPPNYFYDWLYINAVNSRNDLKNQVMNYDCFTDIEFNPKKSLNCQARSIAIFVGLSRSGILNESLKNKENFLKMVCLGQKKDPSIEK